MHKRTVKYNVLLSAVDCQASQADHIIFVIRTSLSLQLFNLISASFWLEWCWWCVVDLLWKI